MSDLRPEPPADRLPPELWAAIQRAVDPIRAGEPLQYCEHINRTGLDQNTHVTVCVDDHPPIIRCWICTTRHQHDHHNRIADTNQPCLICGNHYTEYEEPLLRTTHRWAHNPDRPETRLAVTCAIICATCSDNHPH